MSVSLSLATAPKWLKKFPRWMRVLWPQWPIAVILALSGLFNILSGFQYEVPAAGQSEAFSEMARSFAILGKNTQMVVGGALILVGIGLLWRLRSAWSFAVLLLGITIGINISLSRWGISLILPSLMLITMIVLQHHFTRQTVLANYLLSVSSILAVLSYGTFGAYRLGTGFDPDISNLTSAFYYTVITLSTIGYGDFTPDTAETRLFVVSLIVAGMSIFATVIVSTLGPAISRQLGRILTPTEKKMKLKDHVILVGEGLIARNTAQELANRNIPFIQVIEKDGEPFIQEYPSIQGDGSNFDTLKKAGIKDARMVIAALDDDGENAFISLVAKDINKNVQILAVASSAREIHLLKLARADMVFAPAAVGSRLLANLVEGNEISGEFQDLLEGQPSSSS